MQALILSCAVKKNYLFELYPSMCVELFRLIHQSVHSWYIKLGRSALRPTIQENIQKH